MKQYSVGFKSYESLQCLITQKIRKFHTRRTAYIGL